jgi:hypothetical protein
VQRFTRVQERRRCSRAPESRGDFRSDQSGFSDPGNQHLAAACRDGFNGLRKRGRDVLADGAQRLDLDIQNARDLFQDVYARGSLFPRNMASS